MCLAQGAQHGDAEEARTRGPSVSSQTLYNCATALPIIPHGKMTITQLNITTKSKEVSPFPSGDNTAAMNRRESMTNTRHN